MGVTLVTDRGYEKLLERFRRELELLPKPLQLLVEDLSEGPGGHPGVLEQPSDRPDPMVAQRTTNFQVRRRRSHKVHLTELARPS